MISIELPFFCCQVAHVSLTPLQESVSVLPSLSEYLFLSFSCL